jgi:hypothetical protein
MKVISRYQSEVCEKHYPDKHLADECEALCRDREERAKGCIHEEWGYALSYSHGRVSRACSKCHKRENINLKQEHAETIWRAILG